MTNGTRFEKSGLQLPNCCNWIAVRVKKRQIFLANLKRILKCSLSVWKIFLVQKFNGEMLKTSNQSEFLLKINSNRRHVCYQDC